MRRILYYAGVVSVVTTTACESYTLDRRMAELCRKDGGVKVYETVVLPPESFDHSGNPYPGWPTRPQEERLGPEYRYIVERVALKAGDALKGEGELRRTVERIYRRADNKLMGESVSYGRSGGDFFPFGHPTSNHCPVYETASETLIMSVFREQGALAK